MDSVNVGEFKKMLIHTCETIIDNEPYLTRIDSIIGDGDHGIGMKSGFTAMRKMLESHGDFSTIADMVKGCGLELVKTMGGASGVIFGTLFTGGIAALRNEPNATTIQLAEFFHGSEQAIERRGRSKYGQKTMLDALLPATERMKAAAERGVSLKEALKEAYYGALEGAEKSKGFVSKMGRSKNFREATIGQPDPGAVSVSLIFKALYESAL